MADNVIAKIGVPSPVDTLSAHLSGLNAEALESWMMYTVLEDGSFVWESSPDLDYSDIIFALECAREAYMEQFFTDA